MEFNFVKTAVIVVVAIFALAMWLFFCYAVDQRYDCPTLQKISKWGNIIILVVVFAIIIKYDLWC